MDEYAQNVTDNKHGGKQKMNKEKLYTLEEVIAKYKENNRRYDYKEKILPFRKGIYENIRALFGKSPRKYQLIDKKQIYEDTPENEPKDYHWRW